MAVNDFLDMMPATIIHSPFVSRDSYGQPTYGSSTNYRARIVYKDTIIRGVDGSELVSRQQCWVNGTPSIRPTDKVTLPDGTSPPIFNVEKFSDESGDHHVKIFFGQEVI